MENGKRNYKSYEYIEGSAVRKLQPEFEQDTERVQRPRKEKKTAPRRRVRREQSSSIDFVSLVFLTVAVAITSYACVQYLQVQSGITSMSKEIAKKQVIMTELKSENDIALESIGNTIDLNHIYKVATKELGMVHANKNQVITYESTKSNAVKQYGDIPKGTKKSIIDNIIGKE